MARWRLDPWADVRPAMSSSLQTPGPTAQHTVRGSRIALKRRLDGGQSQTMRSPHRWPKVVSSALALSAPPVRAPRTSRLLEVCAASSSALANCASAEALSPMGVVPPLTTTVCALPSITLGPRRKQLQTGSRGGFTSRTGAPARDERRACEWHFLAANW